jgi:hypothetical protein
MLIAFTCAITLVPAALAIFNPTGEERPMGLTWLAPRVDWHLRGGPAGTPLLLHVPFDFNPNDLQIVCNSLRRLPASSC